MNHIHWCVVFKKPNKETENGKTAKNNKCDNTTENKKGEKRVGSSNNSFVGEC